MIAVWIPPMDRSKFLSNMMASALGAAVTMPICGYMISWFGWQSTFYLTGNNSTFFFDFPNPLKSNSCSIKHYKRSLSFQVASECCGHCAGLCLSSKLQQNIREFPMKNATKSKTQSVSFQSSLINFYGLIKILVDFST